LHDYVWAKLTVIGMFYCSYLDLQFFYFEKRDFQLTNFTNYFMKTKLLWECQVFLITLPAI